MFDIDGYMEDRKREEEIRCPHCDESYEYEFSYWDDVAVHLITYWGNDGIKIECEFCRKEFFVTEKVRRTYEVRKRDL